MSEMTLDGKVAIVTGAGAGIGLAAAKYLAAAGARIVLNDLDESSAFETQDAIDRGGLRSAVVAGSVANQNTADTLIKEAGNRWRRLDILVNGATVRRDARVELMPEEWFTLVLDVIVKGTFHCIQAARPLMCGAAEQEGVEGNRMHRKVINISSMAGIRGEVGSVNYAAATSDILVRSF